MVPSALMKVPFVGQFAFAGDLWSGSGSQLGMIQGFRQLVVKGVFDPDGLNTSAVARAATLSGPQLPPPNKARNGLPKKAFMVRCTCTSTSGSVAALAGNVTLASAMLANCPKTLF